MNAGLHFTDRPAFDLEPPQMRQRLAGGQAERRILDLAGEEHSEAVDRTSRRGKPGMKRIEAVSMAGGEGVEAGVEAGEGLAMGRED